MKTLPRKSKNLASSKKNGKACIFYATPKTISTSQLFLGNGATFPRKSWMDSYWLGMHGLSFFQGFLLLR
jgi:hypothetical protein